ncbi:MAG TPA: hypothetical protein VFH60_13080 [Chloroflexia bacterium]|nr:hypothetical protein [Chloroflexia bacterium]
MRKHLRLMKLSWGVSALLTLAVPTIASAHEAIGDDELAVANWMLVGAMFSVVLGLLFGYWAFRSGQFSNVEESKFTMLDMAEDYEAIMSESDAREAAILREEQRSGTKPTAGTKAANSSPGAGGEPATRPTGI